MEMKASRLRIFRVMSGLSQTGLAQKTGLSQPYISLIETNKAIPTTDIRKRLANAVGVDDSERLFEEH